MIEKKPEEKIQELQLLEHNLQNFLLQKQNLQNQLMEIESALTESENKKEVYKIISNIMVKTDSETLKKDLESRKETVGLRISTIDKQEKRLRDKAQSLQAEVLSEIKKENGSND